jgi:hypothetical protein
MSDSRIWIHIPLDPKVEPFVVTGEEIVAAYHVHESRTFLVPGCIWSEYLATRKKLGELRAEMADYFPPPQLVAMTDPTRTAKRA